MFLPNYDGKSVPFVDKSYLSKSLYIHLYLSYFMLFLIVFLKFIVLCVTLVVAALLLHNYIIFYIKIGLSWITHLAISPIIRKPRIHDILVTLLLSFCVGVIKTLSKYFRADHEQNQGLAAARRPWLILKFKHSWLLWYFFGEKGIAIFGTGLDFHQIF